MDAATSDDPYAAMLILLAGIAASKIMQPHHGYFVHMLNAWQDWDEAKYLASTIHPNPGEFTERFMVTTARRFVNAEWPTIARIGDALATSANRMLTYRECKSLALAVTQ
jgi:hypothetical protein